MKKCYYQASKRNGSLIVLRKETLFKTAFIFFVVMIFKINIAVGQGRMYFTTFASTPSAAPIGTASWTSTSNLNFLTTTLTGWTGYSAVTYPAYGNTTSSSGTTTLTLSTPFALVSNGTNRGKIIVHWGAVSNRPLNISLNGASNVQIDAVASSPERSVVREVSYDIPNAITTLSSLKFVSSGGSGVFLFDIEIQTYSYSSATNHFRSKQTGNWSSASTWESSVDNATWIDATLAPTATANTISILATHTVTVDANTNVSNTNIAATGTLTVAPNIALTVPASKTIANSGTFTLQSSAAGTGSIASSAGSITGNVTIQRYIPSGLRAYRFLANPFNAAMPLTQLTDDIDITGNGSDAASPAFAATPTNAASAFSYDPTITNAGTVTAIGSGGGASTDPGWVPYTTAAGTVGIGDGFRVLIRGSKNQTGSLTGGAYTPDAVTLSASGALNATGNFAKTITYSSGNPSYNLIGNPYPSNVNLKTVTPGAGANNNFWIFNPHQGTKGGYIAYAFGTNDYSLPTFAGFVVQATAGTGNTITFHEADKTTTDTSTMLRTTNGTRNIVEMSIASGNIFWDRFMLQLDKKGTADYDARWDANKFANNEVNFYSLTNDRKALAVDVRAFEADKVIPMGFISNAARNYTLTVHNYELDNSVSLYLRDKYLGTETKVEEGMSYQFSTNADAASQGESRFELAQKSVPVLIPLVSSFSIKLSPNPATDIVNVIFSNEKITATTISITNAEGKTFKTVNAGNVQNGQVSINVKGLAKGNYYVTLINGKERKTEKLIIQ